MKEFRMSSTVPLSLKAAFERGFGVEGLSAIHGGVTIEQDWKDNQRRYSFIMAERVSVPPVLSTFIPSSVRVRVWQKRDEKKDQIHLVNKLRLNVMAQELFMVRPRITLRALNTNETALETYVRVDALLPPGLDKVAESFMIGHSEKEYERLHAHLRSLSE